MNIYKKFDLGLKLDSTPIVLTISMFLGYSSYY